MDIYKAMKIGSVLKQRCLKQLPSDLYAFYCDVLCTEEQNRILGQNESIALWKQNVLDLHYALWWAESGFPVFELTESALTSFLLTNFDHNSISDVRFPFSSFVLRIPPVWYVTDPQTEVRSPIEHLMVHTYTQDDASLGMPIPEGVTPIHTFWRITSSTKDGYSLSSDRIKPETGKDFEAYLSPLSREKTIDVPEDMYQIQLVFHHLVLMVCLYVASCKHGVVKKPRSVLDRCRTKKKRSQLSNIWIIGKSIKLDANLTETAEDWLAAHDGNQKRWHTSISKRFTVRGHWRWQVCGKDRKERKRIWIAPFWKGPKDGIKITHQYEPA